MVIRQRPRSANWPIGWEILRIACLTMVGLAAAYLALGFTLRFSVYLSTRPTKTEPANFQATVGVPVPYPSTCREEVASHWLDFFYAMDAVAGEFDLDELGPYLKQLDAAGYAVEQVKAGDEGGSLSWIPGLRHGLRRRAPVIDREKVVAAAEAVGGAVLPGRETDRVNILITHEAGAPEAWFYMIVWHD